MQYCPYKVCLAYFLSTVSSTFTPCLYKYIYNLFIFDCPGSLLLCRLLSALASPAAIWASVVVTHTLSCSTTRGIFPDQGLNLCLLHWQADSPPLIHHISPHPMFSHTSDFHSFRRLNNIPLCVKTIFCLSVHCWGTSGLFLAFGCRE